MGLPKPLGPYYVGFGDFQVKSGAKVARSLRESSESGKESAAAAGSITVDQKPFAKRIADEPVVPAFPVMRIYYPTEVKPSRFASIGRRWLPAIEYMYGYCCLAFAPISTLNKFKCWTAAVFGYCFLTPQAHLYATPAAPPAPPSSEAGKGINSDGRMPVIIFSHGLWAMRTTYSSFCSDLASHGYVVVAPEHLDGSACMAMSVEPSGKQKWYPHRPMGVTIDDVPFDQRKRQLEQRRLEIKSCLDTLEKISAGDIPDTANAISNYSTLKVSTLAGRLDLRQVGMAGHSFGGLTAAYVTGTDERIKCCVSMDAWWTPLNEEDVKKGAGGLPLLCINNSSFNGSKLRSARRVYYAARRELKKGGQAPITDHIVIQGSNHQDQSDIPLLMPRITRKTGASGPLGAVKTKSICSHASLEFFHTHLLPEGRHGVFDVHMTEDDLSNIKRDQETGDL